MSAADANLEICCKYNHCIFRLKKKKKKNDEKGEKSQSHLFIYSKKIFF